MAAWRSITDGRHRVHGFRSSSRVWAAEQSAVLAILLAMSLGFSAVVVIAIALYVVAAATLR